MYELKTHAKTQRRKGIFFCASASLREIKCRPIEMQEL